MSSRPTVPRILGIAAAFVATISIACGPEEQPTTCFHKEETACGDLCVDLRTSVMGCGACGVVCPAGTGEMPMCLDGRCATATVIWSGPDVFGLALDDAYVFWGSHEGNLMRAPKSGGAADVLATTNTYFPMYPILARSGFVYWSVLWDGIFRAPADGSGTVAKLADAGPLAFAVDAENLYWVDRVDLVSGKLLSAPLIGGSPTELAALPGTGVGLTIDSSYAYVVSFEEQAPSGDSLLRVPKGGGSAEVLASVPLDTTILMWTTVDAENVYWWTEEALWRAPKGGGEAVMLADAHVASFADTTEAGIALDATDVYFAMRKTVARIPKQGGTPVPVARTALGLGGLAIDDAAVYFGGRDRGHAFVAKVAK